METTHPGRKPKFVTANKPNMFRRVPEAIGVYGAFTLRDGREARALTYQLRKEDPNAPEVEPVLSRFQSRISLNGTQYFLCTGGAFTDPTPEQVKLAASLGKPTPKGGVELAAEAYDNAAYYTRHFQNPVKELNFPEHYETEPPPPTEATKALLAKLEAQASVDPSTAFRTVLKPLASARSALVATLENSPHLSEDAQEQGFQFVSLLRRLEEDWIPNLLPDGSLSPIHCQRLNALLCEEVVQIDNSDAIPADEVASFVSGAIEAALGRVKR